MQFEWLHTCCVIDQYRTDCVVEDWADGKDTFTLDWDFFFKLINLFEAAVKLHVVSIWAWATIVSPHGPSNLSPRSGFTSAHPENNQRAKTGCARSREHSVSLLDKCGQQLEVFILLENEQQTFPRPNLLLSSLLGGITFF